MEPIANNTSHVKRHNVELVRSALMAAPGSKLDLARATGLSLATCGTILNDLAAAGEASIAEGGSTGGRPARVYRFNPDSDLSLALFVDSEGGDRRIVHALFDGLGRQIDRVEQRQRDLGAAAIEAALAERLSGRAGVKSIGVGVPGIVNRGVVGGGDVDALRGVALAERLSGRFGLPVAVENDMNASAYGYFHGRGRRLDSLAMVIVPESNGPGTGIVVEGRILRGHSGFAGEVHYLPEQYNPLFQAPRDRGEFTLALGRMLATIAALVDPQRIVLTGGLVAPGMMAELVEACGRSVPREHMPELEYLSDHGGDYLDGLRRLAQERRRYPYRLTAAT